LLKTAGNWRLGMNRWKRGCFRNLRSDPLKRTPARADVVRTLENVRVRLRLKEIGLEVPHLIVAVTLDGKVVLRSNVSPDVLRSHGEDLIDVAGELTAPPEPGDTTHWWWQPGLELRRSMLESECGQGAEMPLLDGSIERRG
jgi:hypothetical protein